MLKGRGTHQASARYRPFPVNPAADRPLLVFPIEILNRELDYRIFLAAMCAAQGSRVLLGQHNVLHKLLPRLRSGVYVGKNIFPTLFNIPGFDRVYNGLAERDFGLVHLDEEGAVFLGSDEEAWRTALLLRLDPRVLSVHDEVCVWGRFQERAFAALDPSPVASVTATGHPRFDLLRERYRWFYRDEIDRLHTRYGDNILLFNSTFTMVQSKFGPQYVFSRERGYQPTDASARAQLLDRYSHQQRTFSRVVRLLERLRRDDRRRTIVIRPHPAEDHRNYAAMFRDVPNVAVVHEGSAVPWMLAADALLHCGCTTGIEATIAGKNVVVFQPEQQGSEPAMAAAFGVRCVTEDDVVNALACPPQRARLEPWSHDLMINLDGELDSFAAVHAAITRAQGRRTGIGVVPGPARVRAGQTVRRANALAHAFARRASPTRHENARARRSYFPKLDRGSVRRKVGLIARHSAVPLRVTFHGDLLMVVERDG